MIRYYCDACGIEVDSNFGQKPAIVSSKLCVAKEGTVPKYCLEIKAFSKGAESSILCKDCIVKILNQEL